VTRAHPEFSFARDLLEAVNAELARSAATDRASKHANEEPVELVLPLDPYAGLKPWGGT
jgi:hypothetical protein